MERIICQDFISFSQTVPLILTKAKLADKIKSVKKILLKPNLTINLLPPNTTPIELVEAVIQFCQQHSRAKIVIAEGSGGCDTRICYRELGYEELAEKYDIELIDLNRSRRELKVNPQALKLKKIKLPAILLEDYLILNLPVLKEHSAAKITCAMKNWFGAYLNKFVLTRSWWSKSELHFHGVHQSIIDLNNYIQTDFTLVDASVGQLKKEVGGERCQPPIKKLIAGYDVKAVDRFCCQFFNRDWRKIEYLK